MHHQPPTPEGAFARARYVRQIRDQVRAGKYQVDPQALADRMARALLEAPAVGGSLS